MQGAEAALQLFTDTQRMNGWKAGDTSRVISLIKRRSLYLNNDMMKLVTQALVLSQLNGHELQWVDGRKV